MAASEGNKKFQNLQYLTGENFLADDGIGIDASLSRFVMTVSSNFDDQRANTEYYNQTYKLPGNQ